MSQMGNNKPD